MFICRLHRSHGSHEESRCKVPKLDGKDHFLFLTIGKTIAGTVTLLLFQDLKGLSHEIFGPVYWPVWMHLGLKKNHFWFLNFEEAPSIMRQPF